MKFYDIGGRPSEFMVSAITSSIKSKLGQKLMSHDLCDNINSVTPMINIASTQKIPDTNFGRIDIDVDERKIKLYNDRGELIQSTNISENLNSKIDENPHIDTIDESDKSFHDFIDRFVLGEPIELYSIVDKICKGNTDNVANDLLPIIEDMTDNVLRTYDIDIKLVGGSKTGLIKSIVSFLTNKIKYLSTDV